MDSSDSAWTILKRVHIDHQNAWTPPKEGQANDWDGDANKPLFYTVSAMNFWKNLPIRRKYIQSNSLWRLIGQRQCKYKAQISKMIAEMEDSSALIGVICVS